MNSTARADRRKNIRQRLVRINNPNNYYIQRWQSDVHTEKRSECNRNAAIKRCEEYGRKIQHKKKGSIL